MFESIVDTVGKTPLVRLNKIYKKAGVEIFLKLEGFNPMGSVKDRICVAMIKEAEKYGHLPGKTIVESSSGNTGIGLAMCCSAKGYDLIITMSRRLSIERRKIIRSFGAKLLLVDGGSDDAWDLADQIAASDPSKYLRLHQYKSCANTQVHYDTTGPEIYEQTSGKIDIFVCSIGTTGTIVGAGRFLKEKVPSIKVIGVEPTPVNKQQGLRNLKVQRVPEIFDPSVVDERVEVNDEDAFKTAKQLVKDEGIFAGISTGSTLFAAMKIADSVNDKRIVVISPDRGDRYLSTELYNCEGDEVVWSSPYDKKDKYYE
ncbi:MAG: cysteine synthase [Planctomycetes bacterium]|nr:cysteine synthase [Planctomycetota bacterium]